MPLEQLTKALSSANKMVALARHKALGSSSLAGAISSGSGYSLSNQSLLSASEQYEHNRGWVYACVDLISKRVAGQRICLAKKVTQTLQSDKLMTKHTLPLSLKSLADSLEAVTSHPLLDLLHDPWDLGTAFTLMYVTIVSLEITGRQLWYLGPGKDKKPQIFPIPSSWIRNINSQRTVWTINLPNGSVLDLPGEQVVHFHYPDPADPYGCLSPLSAISRGVLADEAISDLQFRMFRQGQFPGVALTVGTLPGLPGSTDRRPNLTPDQRSQLVEAVRKTYSGVVNYGEPLILDGLIEKVEKLSLTPEEMGFLDSSKLTKARILQGYRVNPILLGETEGANRASAAVADEIFCANKVNPLIEMLSQAMTQWLSPMFSKAGEKLTIWIEPAVPQDSELKAKNWTTAIQQGCVTINEFRRAMLNLEDIDGGDELIEPKSVPASPEVDAAVKVLMSRLNPYDMSVLGNKDAG